MAQAIKRLPIEASAKCSGTRSGVSITRVSSEVMTADMICYGDSVCVSTRSGSYGIIVHLERYVLSPMIRSLPLPVLTQHHRHRLRIQLVFFNQDPIRKTFDVIVIPHRHLALHDDWPTIQRLVDEMHCATTLLRAMLQRLLLRI